MSEVNNPKKALMTKQFCKVYLPNCFGFLSALVMMLPMFIVLPLTLLFFSTKAQAANSPAQPMHIVVQINIVSSCTVSATDLNFGVYNSSAVSDVNTSLSVLCTSNTPYTIGLDAGLSSIGGNVSTRRMLAGSNALNYSLYQNASRTSVWGDTVGTNTLSSTGTGTSQSFSVYGRIFSNQLSPVGSYSDRITVKVSF